MSQWSHCLAILNKNPVIYFYKNGEKEDKNRSCLGGYYQSAVE
jgi:hypothetical protein